jgi:hypothetical protein
MHFFRESFLLFSLNLLDALLTIIWVRNGVATEGNYLMAKLLDMGDISFLGGKILIGTFVAFVFVRWGDASKLGKYGLTLSLAVYISLMGIHFLTGLSAFGLVSGSMVENLAEVVQSYAAMIG